MARLLYGGPSDETASTRRFEDADIPKALAEGWRLHRANPGEVEAEPVADRNSEPIEPEPVPEGAEAPRPEDSEPEEPQRRRKR